VERAEGDRVIDFDPLQTPEVALGMVGAVLVAGRSAGVRALGFCAWVIGNLFWVAYGAVTGKSVRGGDVRVLLGVRRWWGW